MTGDEYARDVGQRLRRVRLDKGMSLGDVNAASEGRWKAAVIGAYERGDRNITVSRLAELAAFYAVPVAEILPEKASAPDADGDSGRVTLTPEFLNALGPEREIVERFAESVRQRRSDSETAALTIRSSDLDALALALGTTPTDLFPR